MPNNKDHRIYYISDKAYQKLVQFSVRQGYKKLETERAYGMSEFLEDLAYYDFIDTRPQSIIERHNQEIAHDRAPTWTSYGNRRPRMLYLPAPAIQRYITQAYIFGIIREVPYVKGGPSVVQPISVVAYVLEGIGLEWITPIRFPIKRTAVE